MSKYNAQEIADLLNKVDDSQHMCAFDFDEGACAVINNLVSEILDRAISELADKLLPKEVTFHTNVQNAARSDGIQYCLEQFKELSNEYSSIRGK